MGSLMTKSSSAQLAISVTTPTINTENDLSTAVAFGKPFLLRWEPPRKSLLEHFLPQHSSEVAIPSKNNRFWKANEATRECAIGEVHQTSLLTFHAQNADAVNLRGGTTPLVSVQNEAIVSIYANVGTGRYLTLGGVGLRFMSSPQEIRTDSAIARSCEFLIRRVSKTSSNAATSTTRTALNFGEQVTFECVASRGNFLSVRYHNGIGKLVIANNDKCKFALHSPTLKELVQLHASNRVGASSSVEDEEEVQQQQNQNQTSENRITLTSKKPQELSNDFELEEARIEALKEKQWMEAIAARLPVDLAKKIFEFHPDWVRTARLTCKSWQIHAERSIRRIRVNGEFCSLETVEEREALIAFVRRCPQLEVLTLRNVMTLDDNDIAKITENRNLVGLILGGCRRLSDKSTVEIADKLDKLNHLNMAFTNITDESLRIVAERVSQLKELNLYNCSRVTVEGINRTADIAKGLISLEHINLRGTVVDSHLVQDFKRKRPDVVVLTGPASADSIWG